MTHELKLDVLYYWKHFDRKDETAFVILTNEN